jgi:hypothetical protein
MISVIRIKDKLNVLRQSANWDDLALELFKHYEEILDEYEKNREYLDLPFFQKIRKSLEERIDYANKELSNNRNLSDRDRIILFTIKDICDLELAILDENNDDKIKEIEEEIDKELESIGK